MLGLTLTFLLRSFKREYCKLPKIPCICVCVLMMCKEKLPLISIITGSVSKNSLSLLRGPSYHIAVRDGCYYSFSRLLLKNDPKETAPTPQYADTYLRLNDLTEGSSDPLDPSELSQIERGGPLVFDTFIKSSMYIPCMYVSCIISYSKRLPIHRPSAAQPRRQQDKRRSFLAPIRKSYCSLDRQPLSLASAI